jgi:hypothetical protein
MRETTDGNVSLESNDSRGEWMPFSLGTLPEAEVILLSKHILFLMVVRKHTRKLCSN